MELRGKMENKMYNIKMILAYDGGKYNGWQLQGNTDLTIQGKLEEKLSMLLGEEIKVIGSGRTDRGVHALGQVANFHTSQSVDVKALKKKINEELPKDIKILKMDIAGERFHSRLNAKSKIYEYRIWNGEVPNIFERKYCFQYKDHLSIEKMKEAASYLEGVHDFKGFCSNKKMKKSSVREIYSIQIVKEGDWIILSFHGNGFLYNMVRIITGTLIEVGSGKRKVEEVENALESLERKDAGFLAAPEGLFLKEVFYS